MTLLDTPFTRAEYEQIAHAATSGHDNRLKDITEKDGVYKFEFISNWTDPERLNIREEHIYIRFSEVPILSDYFGGKVRTLFAGSNSYPLFIATL